MIMLPIISFSQSRAKIKKKEFRETTAGFKDAWKSVRKGNWQYLKKRPGNFKKTVNHYLTAYEYNADNAELNYKIGVSYLFSSPKSKSLKYLEKAYKTDEYVTKDILFVLARAYHLNSKFEKAIDNYTLYKESLSPKKLKKQEEKLDKYIAECKSGIELVEKPLRAFIDNAGKFINSEFDDYGAAITVNGKKMFYTSRRDINTKGRRSNVDYLFNEDVYFSERSGEDWQESKRIESSVNSKRNDAVAYIAPDGQKLYIYRGYERNGDLYESRFKKEKWSSPSSMTKKINSKKYKETSMSIAHDQSKLYFVSNKKKGFGGKDIYICNKSKNGKRWKKASNIGNVINTEYDEATVFISPDGKTLYFSSKGHNTMGGYDIFKSTFKDSAWSKPVNLGFPINTPGDDLFFTILPNGREAYFSSEKDDGNGGMDIYKVTILSKEKPMMISGEDNLIASISEPTKETSIEKQVEIQTKLLTIVKGKVLDYNTGNPLTATIEIVDNDKNSVINTLSTKGETGEFVVPLESGKNYGIAIKTEGYLFHSENFVIPDSVKHQVIEKDVKLQPMIAGSKIILHNTFFESGKSTLQGASFSELDRIVKIFKDYPNLFIEISGHTDNRGSMVFNRRLSKARAQSVVNYLISKGVNKKKAKAVGFYYKFPIADNKTEEGRAKNRRVEAKILSN